MVKGFCAERARRRPKLAVKIRTHDDKLFGGVARRRGRKASFTNPGEPDCSQYIFEALEYLTSSSMQLTWMSFTTIKTKAIDCLAL